MDKIICTPTHFTCGILDFHDMTTLISIISQLFIFTVAYKLKFIKQFIDYLNFRIRYITLT